MGVGAHPDVEMGDVDRHAARHEPADVVRRAVLVAAQHARDEFEEILLAERIRVRLRQVAFERRALRRGKGAGAMRQQQAGKEFAFDGSTEAAALEAVDRPLLRPNLDVAQTATSASVVTAVGFHTPPHPTQRRASDAGANVRGAFRTVNRF